MIIWSVSGVQLCINKAMYMIDRGTKIQLECMMLTVARLLGKNSICSIDNCIQARLVMLVVAQPLQP